MSVTDVMPTLKRVTAKPPGRLSLQWSNGAEVELDVAQWLTDPAFTELHTAGVFGSAQVGDWGHSVVWPNGVEMGADSLWHETLSVRRRDDVREFLAWRLKHGLSLAKTAETLGLSRRMVAYYSSGEHAVPRHILLACLGWEATKGRRKPASLRIPA